MTRPAIGRVAPERRRTSGARGPEQSGRETSAGAVPEPGTARIAVDLLGGDHAPAVVVDGALRACQTDPSLHLLLVGPVEAADAVLRALDPADRARVQTITAPAGPLTDDPGPARGRTLAGDPPASERRESPDSARTTPNHPNGRDDDRAVLDRLNSRDDDRAAPGRRGVADDERPPLDRGGVRTPRGLAAYDRAVSRVDAGVRTAMLAVAQGQADAVLSAGNTGAIVTSAALGLGRWPGVRRPALAAVLPTAAGRLVLLDVGSSVDPDAATLAMHARLGAAYAATVHGVSAPRVGLLTIGTERGKGDRLRRAAPGLLAGLDLPAGGRYCGLIEGNDVVTGAAADVVVTDGFSGNVLLKGLETAYALIGAPHPDDVPPRAAVLLGVAGTVVVCHGAASATDVAAGIALAAGLHRRAAVPVITDLISSLDPSRGGS